jgi:hypothetical protein
MNETIIIPVGFHSPFRIIYLPKYRPLLGLPTYVAGSPSRPIGSSWIWFPELPGILWVSWRGCRSQCSIFTAWNSLFPSGIGFKASHSAPISAHTALSSPASQVASTSQSQTNLNSSDFLPPTVFLLPPNFLPHLAVSRSSDVCIFMTQHHLFLSSALPFHFLLSVFFLFIFSSRHPVA